MLNDKSSLLVIEYEPFQDPRGNDTLLTVKIG
jgi:hypothetical protein